MGANAAGFNDFECGLALWSEGSEFLVRRVGIPQLDKALSMPGAWNDDRMGDFLNAMEQAAELGPEAAVTVGGVYLYRKLLGPSVDALVSTLGEFTAFRARNLLGLSLIHI